MQQAIFLGEDKFPEDTGRDALGSDAGVGFNSPAQIRASPGTQPMAAHGMPDEADWREKFSHRRMREDQSYAEISAG